MSARRGWMAASAVVGLLALGTGGARDRLERNPANDVAAPNAGAAEAPKIPEPASKPDDLRWAANLNADVSALDPKTFRQGHATRHELPPTATTRSPGRFEVKLPSGAPITTPAVHAGKLLFSGGFHGREFYAVDAKTGAPAWGASLDDDGPSAPACADGICVFNTESCTIFALEAATGEQRWAWWMGDPMLSAPAIAQGTVFTSYPAPGGHADASHVVVALDLRSGAVKWQRRLDGDIVSAPVAVGDALHLTTFSGSVFTLAQSDGALRSVVRGRATSAPTVTGGQVYWSTRSEQKGQSAREALVRSDGRGERQQFADRSAPYLDATVQKGSGYAQQGAALDASNGFGGGAPSTAKAQAAEANIGRGSVATLQSFQGSRIASDGANNFATMGDEVVATDAKTGEEKWRRKVADDFRAGGNPATSPALAGGKVVVGTLQGQVLIMDPISGKVERTLTVGHPVRSQPVVEDGWVYVGTEDGLVVGIDTNDPRLDGWAMWGGDAARTAAAR